MNIIQRFKRLVSGEARSDSKALAELKRINRAALNSPEHQRAIKELPPSFTF